MPDTKVIEQRRESALQRIATALQVDVRTLRGEARGNPPLARVITLENIAAAVEKALTPPKPAKPASNNGKAG